MYLSNLRDITVYKLCIIITNKKQAFLIFPFFGEYIIEYRLHFFFTQKGFEYLPLKNVTTSPFQYSIVKI